MPTTPGVPALLPLEAALPLPSLASRNGRAVRRASQDLRAGTPVVLESPRPPAPDAVRPQLLLAVETATEASLAEFSACSAGFPTLIVAGAAADPVAVAVAPADLTPDRLRALAHPGHPTLPDTRLTPPSHAAPALKLARTALLLPAILSAPLATPAPDLLRVSAASIAAFHPNAQSLARVVEAAVPLADARDCRVVAFRPEDGGIEHLAVLIGTPEQSPAPLVRLHSECFTGDLLGSLRCDCGPQLHGALQRMAAEGAGVLLYLAQEGRGIGLVNKLRAYALQDSGLDTLEANLALGFAADERSFAPAADMLRALGIPRIRLLTNNPQKLAGLAACGIEIAGRVPLRFAANGVNDAYLETKARRFGHLLS